MSPGKNPNKNRIKLIKKSFVKRPRLRATASGGTKMAMKTRNQSRACIFFSFLVVCSWASGFDLVSLSTA